MLLLSHWTIASMHRECVQNSGEEENTRALVGAVRNPAVDMLGHIDDLRMPNRFETVIREAGAHGKIIEINNNSLKNRTGSIPRVEEVARLCARHGVRVAVSSDAHFDEMVGRVRPALDLLSQAGFPDELIVNRTMDAFQSYQDERRVRMAKAKEQQ
jgi:putative hydrolase